MQNMMTMSHDHTKANIMVINAHIFFVPDMWGSAQMVLTWEAKVFASADAEGETNLKNIKSPQIRVIYQVNIGSDNGLVSLDDMSLPEPMLTKFYDPILVHMSRMIKEIRRNYKTYSHITNPGNFSQNASAYSVVFA